MQRSLGSVFDGKITLDVVPGPFLFDLNWFDLNSFAQELTDAACRPLPPLNRFGFASSANDATRHRSSRRTGFLVLPPPSHFRICG